MSRPSLELSGNPGTVWRVGFKPDPWAWPDWKYAQEDGRFGGRWDDERAQFRTIYTADSLYSCFIELLAKFRPHRDVDDAVMAIEDPDNQAARFPEYPAGTINFSWFDDRAAARATQTGRYCFVTHSNSVAVLRQNFDPDDYGVHAADFDAALLKDSAPRVLTRSIARWLYELSGSGTESPAVDGIEFRSRHGDDLRMWAVFERPDQGEVSPHVDQQVGVGLTPEVPDLARALQLHGLKWSP